MNKHTNSPDSVSHFPDGVSPQADHLTYLRAIGSALGRLDAANETAHADPSGGLQEQRARNQEKLRALQATVSAALRDHIALSMGNSFYGDYPEPPGAYNYFAGTTTATAAKTTQDGGPETQVWGHDAVAAREAARAELDSEALGALERSLDLSLTPDEQETLRTVLLDEAERVEDDTTAYEYTTAMSRMAMREIPQDIVAK